jgi:hypothetical protein
VNFITDTGGDVIIESVVSKSASSNNVSNDRIFYQTLLGYNSTVPYLAFALIDIQGEYHITLKAAFRCSFLNPQVIFDVLNLYDLAYSQHIPRIEEVAEELGLSFTGRLDRALRQFIEGIIE